VDIAPTIAQLLGTRVDRSWVGRSLFAPPSADGLHDVFSYTCREDGSSPFAFLDGTRKVVLQPREGAPLEHEVGWAFDLAANPAEADTPQLSSEAVAELLRRWRRRLDEAQIRRLVPERVTLTQEREEELRELGYM
jgi:hypothetical protein